MKANTITALRDRKNEVAMSHLREVSDSMRRHGLNAEVFQSSAEAVEELLSMIPSGASVGFGGSVTLLESGVLDALRSRNDITLLDRDAPDLSSEEIAHVMRQSMNCDFYLSSANALTMDGRIVNIDGRGNRVSACIFGPSKVIYVIGYNKVCRNLDEAIGRIRTIASPANCRRLGIDSPCSKLGRCPEKNVPTPNCICISTVIIDGSRDSQRVTAFLVNENLGY
ncbi:MAG: lactate utilization protein [Candidatus Wallbacteria bacterium HGW-Wallbacteria-1]|jgi:hypothetical protein|uniref:Lactate utilization protein n=1 Tax=Candidatus Wallbacteria bacterium HGW-Wallbacteria-1 TaxID=2013854 RepID=A0A2N1PR88_9BACT|nr:MAG: lactate utilization protein [Candidatus Wallbacteria bacterium HGW-Wallbacteria-1]